MNAKPITIALSHHDLYRILYALETERRELYQLAKHSPIGQGRELKHCTNLARRLSRVLDKHPEPEDAQ
jgi:hypothetical protein